MTRTKTIQLVQPDGSLYSYALVGAALEVPKDLRFRKRIAFAAAHVVLDPLKTREPLTQPVIDWETTLAYREYLWSLGLGVAEAMDTAQRGMGLGWPQALELIQRSVRAAKARGGKIASGAGTDQLQAASGLTLQQVTDAYLEQCAAIEAAGSQIILMASRALARVAKSVDDYARVYGEILRQVKEPVLLHWLGPMFDPELEGYWGGATIAEAMDNCLEIIRANPTKIDGIKISLLDAELEVEMRSRLPESVHMYTGDDFNYDRLIAGDDKGYSHALLGIFDPIAPAAALALSALDHDDMERYRKILEPTVPLSRHIFAAPTYYYKTGVVFLAYLNGFQKHFRMICGLEAARSLAHLCELFVLADKASLLRDPDLALVRMRNILLLSGVA
ncbi:MAG: dihydrodipicolinate synthase family protein [Acidobacteriaceae bacterium]